MATGGAWQSEAFDNGSDYQKPMPYATQGMSVATPPAIYNAPVSGANNKGAFGVLAVSLRIAQILLTLLALAIMGSNKQTFLTEEYGEVTVKFSDFKAFVAVLAMSSVVCFYAIAQLVHSIVNMASSGTFASSATTGFALITFLFDTVLAYALLAAAVAGAKTVADYVVASELKFIQKGQASVAMAFLAFAVLAASAVLYPIRLRRVATS